MDEPIYFYSKTDHFFELSNFYPQGFEEDGVYWPTVEHYFQAMKFKDQDYREKIRAASSPKQAKDLGRTRDLPIQRDWDSIRDGVMKHALRRKFAHPDLRQLLLSTGDRELIEKSPYDRYWGCGADGTGENKLGTLLMEVRDEYAVA